MLRRQVIRGAPLALLSAPRVSRAASLRQLRFVPNSDLTIVDPVWTAAFVTRLHGLMVYDTLYGQDDSFTTQPQMAAGHVVEDGGRLWRITLRAGLRFHDGTPVLARDVVASLRRWGRIDAFGQTLMAVTDSLDAPSDKEVRFRLKIPFPLLADALGKSTAYLPVIMPERLANAGNERPLTEVIGSGPFRYAASERVDGVRTVYEKFREYEPREGGETQFTAGPKIAYLDRVEWLNIPDDGTAAAALQRGEIDWWERPLTDLLPVLQGDPGITVDVIDRTGFMGIIRFNHLYPPFDKAAIRRAALGAISQRDIVAAESAGNPQLMDDRVGVFTPESPMSNDAGLGVLTGPRDPTKVKRDLAAAGYRGEPVLFLTPPNNQATNTISQVAAESLRQCGFNIELVSLDFTSWLQRRASRAPAGQGGWNASASFFPGVDMWDPASHLAIRGNGSRAWVGWPESARLEELRSRWFAAPDEAARQAVCREIQLQVWQDVPYIPGGRWRQPTAYRRNVTGVLRGMPLFYNVRV